MLAIGTRVRRRGDDPAHACHRHRRAARAGPGECGAGAATGRPASPSTVGAIAWSGHSRVVAEYAPTSTAMIAIGTSTRGAEGRTPRRVAQQLGADGDVRRRRGIEIAGRGRGVRDRVFVDPGERDAAGRRRSRSAPMQADCGEGGRRIGGGGRCDGPTTPGVEAPTAGAGVASPRGCRRRPAPAPPRRRTWPSAARWNRRCRVRTLRRPRSDDPPLTPRAPRGRGWTASSGVIRLNYLVAAGAIIIGINHGSPVCRAERKRTKLRPSNLIWVMPAQGGEHT